MEISAPAGKARVNLNGDFSATELEEIISSLARARASLEPPVPTTRPGPDSNGNVLVQEDALFNIVNLAAGGLRFWVRNEGVGWLAFTISAEQRASLQTFLNEKLGHSHVSH